MHFQFLKPRKDVASAEQVRALRERRGWTVEQLADEVHASPLEVSAWEAGTVEVPSRQALLIRWQTERAVWSEALKGAQAQTCTWVPENAPDLYEHMFRKPAGSWYARDALVAAHLADCARCKDVWQQAKRIGGFPAKPDTSGSLRSRYGRWVDRLPERAQWPFMAAGLAVGQALPLSFIAFWAPDVWVGFLLAGAAFWATVFVRGKGLSRWFLPLLAGGVGGLLGWSIFPGNSLTELRPWVYAGSLVAVMEIVQLVAGRAGKRKARALTATRTQRPSLPPPSELTATFQRGDSAGVRIPADA